MSIFAVSDIHGNLVAFKDLIAQANIDFMKDKLYILGDMVDWGVQPLDTMLFINDLCTKYPNSVFATLGNHELLMLSALRGNDETVEVWLSNHGGVTLEQLQGLAKSDTEGYKELLSWLRSLKVSYEEQGYIFTHSSPLQNEDTFVHGISSRYFDLHPEFSENIVQAVWMRVELYKDFETGEITAYTGLKDGKTLVSGHTITAQYHDSCDIFQTKGYINIDCGAKLLGKDKNNIGVKLGMLEIDGDIKKYYYSQKVK